MKSYKKLQGEELNEVKVLLANSVTEIVHGAEKASLAAKSSKSILENNLEDNRVFLVLTSN